MLTKRARGSLSPPSRPVYGKAVARARRAFMQRDMDTYNNTSPKSCLPGPGRAPIVHTHARARLDPEPSKAGLDLTRSGLDLTLRADLSNSGEGTYASRILAHLCRKR